jgi:hypothetical protein
MWASIELGAEFYFDEDDYLSEAARAMRQAAKTPGVKVEPSSPRVQLLGLHSVAEGRSDRDGLLLLLCSRMQCQVQTTKI